MAFAEWTFSGTGAGALDAAVKYAGASSYKSSMVGVQGTSDLTHNTFSQPQMMVITWARSSYTMTTINVKPKVNHSSYGDLILPQSGLDVWEKFKTVFWYDVGSNTKFGRVYKWSAGAWVQQGSDTNFGSGSPSAGSVALKHWSNRIDTYVWFDEVEVYS